MSSPNVGYATLQVIPSALGFSQALQSQVAPGIAGAGTQSGKKFGSSFLTQFKAVAGPMAALLSVKVASDFAKTSINAASDLNETISKTGVIFGQSSKQMLSWSKNSATALGMSRTAALDGASSFAILGKAAGLNGQGLTDFSQKFVGLSADMASFFNTSPEEAMTAISAGMRGEAEPLRKYGVLLDDASLRAQALKMGLISSIKEGLTPQAKALAASQVILAQTSDAQGDFARTASGYANMARTATAASANFAAKIGTVLLPVAKLFQSAFVGTINVLTAIPTPVYAAATVFGALAATLFIVPKAIALTKLGVKGLGTGLKALKVQALAAGNAMKAAFIANPIAVVVAAIVAIGVALFAAYQKFEGFRKVVNASFRAIAPVVGAFIGFVVGAISSALKIMTAPMKVMLTVLSKLPGVGKFAKGALDILDSLYGKVDGFAKGAKGAVTNWANGLSDKIPTETKKAAAVLKGSKVIPAAATGLGAEASKKLSEGLGAGFIKAIQGSADDISGAFTSLTETIGKNATKKVSKLLTSTQSKLLALSAKRDLLKEQYSSASESLQNLKKEAADYTKSVSEAIAASAKISDAKSFKSMVRELTGAVTKAKAFSEAITALKSAGLNSVSLKQLVDAGPQSALKAAQALVKSGAIGIAQINSLQGSLNDQGQALGNTAASALYDKAIAESQALVDVISTQLKTIEDRIVSVGAAFAKELSKIEKIKAPAWLKDLASVTNYTDTSATKSTAITPNSGTNKQGPSVQVTVYNPIAEPTSVTTSRTLTRLALLG